MAGDTIVAIATAPGRGGIAVVRVSGPEAFGIAKKITSADVPMLGCSDARMTNRIFAQHAHFYDLPSDHRTIRPTEHVIDDGILLAFKGPFSYTGEDVVEFQCHGGAVTSRRILEACCAAGARLAHRGEFTERAFLNGKLDYDQAESVLDLIDAKTPRSADAALAGLSGRKTRALKSLYEQALELSSTLEHALDVSEEELPESFFTSLRSSFSVLHSSLRDAISKAAEGRLLNRGALVVLAGPPNAGKSSLMNALLEENRAIVSDVPGTTRDAIEAWLDLDGWPIRLTDTAGLRVAKDEVEGEGVKRAEDLLSRADLVLWLGAASSVFRLPSSVLLLHAKCDLGRGEGLNVSAKTGEGLEALKKAIVERLEARISSADSADTDLSSERLVVFREVLALIPDPCSLFPDSDLVLLANAMRTVSERLGSLVGATYSSDLLENLFSRFCVGK